MFHPVQHCMVNRLLWVHLHNHSHNATWHFQLYFTQFYTACYTFTPSSPSQPHPQCNMTLPVELHVHNHTHNATWHCLLYFTQSHTACYTGSSEFTCTTTPTMQCDTSCCTSPISNCLLHWFLWVHLHNHTHDASWHHSVSHWILWLELTNTINENQIKGSWVFQMFGHLKPELVNVIQAFLIIMIMKYIFIKHKPPT